MIEQLRKEYELPLAEINQVMLSELDRWRSAEIDPIWSVTHRQLQRNGKQLRPLLALMIADLLGGELSRVVPAAASVELYHIASLVLDDVQDNSEIRRGEPTVNASTSKSAAINVALFVRSLSYHVVHFYPGQDPADKLRMHQQLDIAATHLILGQSIDVGWHEGWYKSHLEFPYLRMIEGKSGALFGCAAAMGACASNPDPAVISAARDYGTEFGVLYQMVDDYLDIFGDGSVLRRPPYDDLREGKMTGPVLCLLAALQDAGCAEDTDLVLRSLADRGSPGRDWSWLLTLMSNYGVADTLRKQLSDRAAQMARPPFAAGRPGRTGSLAQLVDVIVAPAFRE